MSKDRVGTKQEVVFHGSSHSDPRGTMTARSSSSRSVNANATSPEAVASEPVSSLGGRIRLIRKDKNKSLVEISGISGVSVAMLSHIERGKATPSLKVLEKVRSALEVSMLDLFPPAEEEAPAATSPVVRSEDRISLEFDEIGLTKEKLSPDDSRDLELLMLKIAPGGGSGPEPWTRPGEKGGLILSGEARLQIGEEVFDLKPGDSFQFNSSIPHKFKCLGSAPAEIVWIIKSNRLAKAVDA